MASAALDVQTYLNAADVSIAAGDYATAEQWAARAMAKLAGLPNIDGPAGKYEYRETIVELMRQIRIMKSSALNSTLGVQRVNIHYQEPAD